MKRSLCVLTLVCAIALLVVGAGTANVLPPQSNAHGASLGEWAKRYFVFDASIPVVNDSHPGIDVGDVDCGIGQSGRVWFLETSPEIDGDIERRCSVPTGTTLYMPVFQWICFPEVDGVPIPECLDQADDIFSGIEMNLSVDGVTIGNERLQDYRATTGAFDLPLVEDSFWEWLSGLELGDSMPFAADAIGVLVSPLSVGAHEIVLTWTSDAFGFDGSVTYSITVTPGKKPA
jgi:hypothetical protein